MNRKNFYQGPFKPRNPEKYRGNPHNIVYRSGWEFQLMNWCDTNPNVTVWASEETVVPYTCKTDGKNHRYFIDFTIQFSNGQILLIELKPKKQIEPPTKSPRQQKKRYILEVLTYAKNVSKWEAAKKFAKAKGCEFHVWTEEHLKALGIPVL